MRQLVADVWQDEHTTGARPPLGQYQAFDAAEGLYRGPIDGLFSIYHHSIRPLLASLPFAPYAALSAAAHARLGQRGQLGLLDCGISMR